MDRRCQHSLGSPPPLRPNRAAQTAAQGFSPADSPTTTTNQKKRDTSNEVRKGTFLKRLDNVVSRYLTHQNVPSSKHDELTPHIDVKLFPSEQVIHPGEMLKLKIEIWNVGPQDILLHKGFLRVRTSMQA